MTAIAGFWRFDGRPDADASCTRMLAALAMYGSDAPAQWNEGAVALGCRLYRMLPQDKFDRQPLVGASGAAMVADVRLDNRDELVGKLALAADRAARMADSEILLAAFERWNEDVVQHLVGEFAFAVWEPARRRMILARDCIGLRPLHYHCADKFFAFASMPKGLHAIPDIPNAPDDERVAEFIALLPESGERSFYKGIGRIEAGHLTVIASDGRASTRRWWHPDTTPLELKDQREYADGLRHHLEAATRARLRGTSGRVATHLSAGLDSSAVTVTAARLLAAEGGEVTAFTSVPRRGYDGATPPDRIADEGPLAAMTAAMYPNIEHVLIRSGGVSPIEDLDRIYHLFDGPMLNLCNWVWDRTIFQSMRERRLTVVLTGAMGNMTASYNGFERLSQLLRRGHLLSLWRESRALAANGFLSFRGAVGQALGPHVPLAIWRLAMKCVGRNDPDLLEYTATRSDRIEEFRLQQKARERGLDFLYRPWGNSVAARLWVLGRVDMGRYKKAVLAGWGVDFRDPTSDQRLIEYCLRVPLDQYLRNGVPRALVKQAFAGLLPRPVLEERRRGLQAIDWHEGLTAARAALSDEIGRLKSNDLAALTLDVARLDRLEQSWPQGGWDHPDVVASYRLALLRGVAAGHFLRKASGGNM